MIFIEEPEAHLSPSAARLLWRHVQALPGQKIVTTHSPYFVQHVPFRDLRLVSLSASGTQVKSLSSTFSASIPPVQGLETLARARRSLHYDRTSETLTVDGVLSEKVYRKLATCCRSHEQHRDLESRLKDLRDRSSQYIKDDELRSLETFARRIRGEIFFAEGWMIVEGQTDYLIVHALAHAMRYDLDWQGVSIIDVQNNGSPDLFAALARALDIPWVAVFDGDAAGRGYVHQLLKRGFSNAELQRRCHLHPDGDLEAQLVVDGLGPELAEILQGLGVKGAAGFDDAILAERLRSKKTAYAAALADRFRASPRTARRGPEAFRKAIGMLAQLK